jgi:hypothetical protein
MQNPTLVHNKPLEGQWCLRDKAVCHIWQELSMLIAMEALLFREEKRSEGSPINSLENEPSLKLLLFFKSKSMMPPILSAVYARMLRVSVPAGTKCASPQITDFMESLRDAARKFHFGAMKWEYENKLDERHCYQQDLKALVEFGRWKEKEWPEKLRLEFDADRNWVEEWQVKRLEAAQVKENEKIAARKKAEDEKKQAEEEAWKKAEEEREENLLALLNSHAGWQIVVQCFDPNKSGWGFVHAHEIAKGKRWEMVERAYPRTCQLVSRADFKLAGKSLSSFRAYRAYDGDRVVFQNGNRRETADFYVIVPRK